MHPQRSELGEFLRSRRSRLLPEDVGLTHYGGRRRVPGLRREELSQLAGVSVAYYTRLEQGQSGKASDAVLDALARVLRLDEHERDHLFSLAGQSGRKTGARRPRPERLRDGVRLLVRTATMPALAIGRGTDILAWNRPAHALLAGHLDYSAPDRPTNRPNLARMVFLDPHCRELYVDWKAKARDAVADLRIVAGRYPDDQALTALIGELSVKSQEFATLWSAHPIRSCSHFVRHFQHPVVGSMSLVNEVVQLPDDEGQRLAMFMAEPGSPSEAALRLLTDLSAEGKATMAPQRSA
ncbi:helix-turn-helix domain-containing protein [Streptomyces sp. 3MP-14]|uniref:Helix-turn-helix domain-containing protein n=1 Tax=Streptomyces mimosae TaxID=2586635 RepID=A0A5N6ALB3_9ACTN|nr:MULTISPECIES: helix-turn-helix transcriptional regulator [Streptomyces]KAB8169647.1 helix-turn-helix domain-containing protein [Streptomyces mimosae]KAB8178395.1 helix-turn-helix domain-containing protein [Streptomyces sp. 3MP-14]